MDEKNMNKRSGSLIVFEGIDGTGKSTQLRLLAEYLRNAGYAVVTTKEPTDGRFGRMIRELFTRRQEISREEELALFLRDRREHVETLLEPALAAGKIILCDRYYLSTLAYQGAAGMDVGELAKMNDFAPEPDLALLFQLPPHISIDRITRRRGDRLNDFEQEEGLKAVEKIFHSLDYPYIRSIDARHSVAAIHARVTEIVETYLQGRGDL